MSHVGKGIPLRVGSDRQRRIERRGAPRVGGVSLPQNRRIFGEVEPPDKEHIYSGSCRRIEDDILGILPTGAINLTDQLVLQVGHRQAARGRRHRKGRRIQIGGDEKSYLISHLSGRLVSSYDSVIHLHLPKTSLLLQVTLYPFDDGGQGFLADETHQLGVAIALDDEGVVDL